jgi:hypothetical protein
MYSARAAAGESEIVFGVMRVALAARYGFWYTRQSHSEFRETRARAASAFVPNSSE